MPSFIHGTQTDRLRDEANIPPIRPSDDRDDLSERAARTNSGASERYFSVRWMLERERARDASDDCGSAFAVIPVVGVCLLTLYVIWLDQTSQGFAVWLVGRSPLSKLLPLGLIFGETWDLAWGEDEANVPGAYA